MQCLDGDEEGAPVYNQRIPWPGSGLGWVVGGLSCNYADKLCIIMNYYASSGLEPDIITETIDIEFPIGNSNNL
jgi:hypothetical protein